MSDKNAPAVGTLTLDTRSGRVGRVMDVMWSHVQLRPPQGGIEWGARPEDLRALGSCDDLSSRVAQLNAHSRSGL
ncbi:hypothetical protein CP981_24750 [Streptomyces platensis]|uniref:Uncharacterized protein n=1 Tax=Streptomyces platensis TaxID=58346 RepID=A0AAE6TPC9_STRPT|nr:hypothetical protein [Streptomyces platensis]QEV54405.1 hypothetical protein CP981_24750 [Streptomyces platensis]